MGPCYECKNRTSDCHSKCKKYNVWHIKHLVEISRNRKETEKLKAYYAKKKK